MELAPTPSPTDRSLVTASSLGARLLNVYATPGDVFEEVRQSPPRTVNWLVPALLGCLISVLCALAIFSQETVRRQIEESQAQAIEKKLRAMPREQREQAKAAAEQFTSGSLMKLFGAVGAGVSSFAWLFLVTLLVWLAGRWVFRSPLGYGRLLEVCGLSSMISLLGGIVTTLLIVGMGNLFVTPGPVLLVREFNPANKLHLALAACNLATWWYIGTLAVGLAKLAGTSALKAFGWLFVPWAVARFGWIALGWGALGQ